MRKFQIPENLIEMLRGRRVIPFIGAGFSSSLGLPNWETLLKQISIEIPDCLPYEDLSKYCNDSLQIAEYYLIKCGKSIGPLRHSIANALHTNKNPVLSGAHIELVNLGAIQIYTTNFDDLIEKTFRNLSEQSEVIALPRDVATAYGSKTQIVKYHGDLRHEATLVLTESSYYSRLDFESPMDLKFRSDLLGKSVLFMGYSFRDINIRIIWFKLMQMMKDIPQSDRPTSYIIRFDDNPVLESLYDDVGIKTIVIDPENEAKTDEGRKRLFNEFMFELASRASINNMIRGSKKLMFLSNSVLELIEKQIIKVKENLSHPPRAGRRIPFSRHYYEFEEILSIAAKRRIPIELKDIIVKILMELAIKPFPVLPATCELAISISKLYGPLEIVTFIISQGLSKNKTRDYIINASVPWDNIWNVNLNQDKVNAILGSFEEEIKFYDEQVSKGLSQADYDIAYKADLANRIIKAQLIDESCSQERKKAEKLINKAKSFVKSIGTLESHPDKAPDVSLILSEIDAMNKDFKDPFSIDIE